MIAHMREANAPLNTRPVAPERISPTTLSANLPTGMRSGMVPWAICFSTGLNIEPSVGNVLGAKASGLFITVSTAPATMVTTRTPKGDNSRRSVLE
jgi:hypothetical protein